MTAQARLCNDDFKALRSLARGRWVQGREIYWKFNRTWSCVPFSNAALDAAFRLIEMGLVENFVCCPACGEVFQLTQAGHARAGQIDHGPVLSVHELVFDERLQAMGLTDAQMLELMQRSLPDIETAPIEHEVHSVVGRYWLALRKTNHKGVFHRFMCWAGDSEALARAASLAQAEKNAQEVLAKSPEHRLVLEQIVYAQPSDLAQKDNLLSLLAGSIKP